MNERIEKLAELAEDYATAEYEKWIPTPDFSGIPNVRKIFNKKFAELIIRECAWIANDPAPSVYDHDSYKLGRKFAGIDVLKHFGVEE